MTKAAQHTPAEANTSRLVTKIAGLLSMSQQRRVDKVEIWQVVSLILKFPFNGDYMRIVGKLVNAFRPSLASDADKDIEISKTNAGRIE